MRARVKANEHLQSWIINTSVGVTGIHRETQGDSLSALPIGGLAQGYIVSCPLPPDVCKHTLPRAEHTAPLARGMALVGLSRALPPMLTPQPGDSILMLRPRWLNLIVSGEKTLEVRRRNLSSGPSWLGCRGMIHGHCFLESALLIIAAEAWGDRRN